MSITWAFLSILSSLVLSTLIPLTFERENSLIFSVTSPAWQSPPPLRSRPSTRKISVSGRVRARNSQQVFQALRQNLRPLLRRIISRALRAASRARARHQTAFWIIRFGDTLGFSSKRVLRREPTKSLNDAFNFLYFRGLDFCLPSQNCGSGTLNANNCKSFLRECPSPVRSILAFRRRSLAPA